MVRVKVIEEARTADPQESGEWAGEAMRQTRPMRLAE